MAAGAFNGLRDPSVLGCESDLVGYKQNPYINKWGYSIYNWWCSPFTKWDAPPSYGRLVPPARAHLSGADEMALPSVACVQEEKPVQHRACGGGGSSRSNSSSSNISRKSRSDSKGQDKGPNGTDFRVVEVPRNRWSCKRNQPWRSMKANIARFHRQTGTQSRMFFDHAQMKGCRPRTNRAVIVTGAVHYGRMAGKRRESVPGFCRCACKTSEEDLHARAAQVHVQRMQPEGIRIPSTHAAGAHACKAARAVAAAWGSKFGGPPLLHVWSRRVPAQTWTLLGGHALQAATGLGDLVPRFLRGQQGLQIVLFQQLDEVNVKGWSLLSVDASDQHSRQIPIQLVVQQSYFCAILLKVAVNSLFCGSSTAVSTFLPFPASSMNAAGPAQSYYPYIFH